MVAGQTGGVAAKERLKKQGLDHGEMRRKREATTVQIRKEKKEDSLQKRRRDIGSSSSSFSNTAAPDKPVGALPDPALRLKLESLPEDIALLQSDDPSKQLEATIRFRKLLSIERNPPIAEVIAAGAVPRLVQYCQCYDNPPLLFEAAWTLTNISSGTSEHTRVVIDNGAIPIFINLVRCPHADVREQAVWALGNIAGDSTRCRDLVLSYNQPLGLINNLLGAMGDLSDQNAPPEQVTMLRNATWTISNLCRGKPPPRWELIAGVLAPLVQLCYHTDEEVLVDACWALSYICEPADRIDLILHSGALPKLTSLLGHTSPAVQTPALRCIGNITSGSAEQTQAVLQCDALSAVGPILTAGRKELKKEACWLVSNVTAGSSSMIDAVCASGMVPSLLQLVVEEEFGIKKEAAYALCNACVGGSLATVSGLVFHGVIAALCPLLEAPDVDVLLAVIDALGACLDAGDKSRQASADGSNRSVQLIDEAGGVEKLEALQMHENSTVFSRTACLLDAYFSDDAAADDPSIAPQAHASSFVFGVPGASQASGSQQPPATVPQIHLQ